MADGGFELNRFDTHPGDQFQCPICSLIVKDPNECTMCGALVCDLCIQHWLQRKKECPKCRAEYRSNNTMRKVQGALLMIYNNIDIKCTNCKKGMKIIDLKFHETKCVSKCQNYNFCGNSINNMVPILQEKQVCDLSCDLFLKIFKASNKGSAWNLNVLKEIESYLKNIALNVPSINNNFPEPLLDFSNNDNSTIFQWDSTKIGAGIELSNNNLNVYLKEQAYMFRTVLGNKGFTGGRHYWEIEADSRTENELKIGVSKRNDFNLNSAFCDYAFGYAYYGLGQLRHNSNASGGQYGKRFKKEGNLGIFLDMNKGQLSFSMNGQSWGAAYTHGDLKSGPIYPAVALLHNAGCKLHVNKPVPNYFS